MAVVVPVTHTCPTSAAGLVFKYLAVQVTQVARAHQIATADDFITPVCSGTPQTTTLRLVVLGGVAPFKHGRALLDATLSTYDDSTATADVVQVSKEIRVVH